MRRRTRILSATATKTSNKNHAAIEDFANLINVAVRRSGFHLVQFDAAYSLRLCVKIFQHAFCSHELPIKIPARKTSAPPSATWNTADAHGVSMNRWRIHEMMPSSTITTPTAMVVAVL